MKRNLICTPLLALLLLMLTAAARAEELTLKQALTLQQALQASIARFAQTYGDKYATRTLGSLTTSREYLKDPQQIRAHQRLQADLRRHVEVDLRRLFPALKSVESLTLKANNWVKLCGEESVTWVTISNDLSFVVAGRKGATYKLSNSGTFRQLWTNPGYTSEVRPVLKAAEVLEYDNKSAPPASADHIRTRNFATGFVPVSAESDRAFWQTLRGRLQKRAPVRHKSPLGRVPLGGLETNPFTHND